MRNFRFTIFMFFVLTLLFGCINEDDLPPLPPNVLLPGVWYHADKGLFSSSYDTQTFTFHLPKYCKYEVVDNSTGSYTEDSLTYYIQSKKLYLLNKNGSPFNTYIIRTLNTKKLTLTDTTGRYETKFERQ